MTYENPTYDEAMDWVTDDFWMRHKKKLSDLRITNVRGYWEDKHPVKVYWSNKPFRYTYYYARPGRGNDGKFLRPYRAWEVIHKHEMKRDHRWNRFANIDIV